MIPPFRACPAAAAMDTAVLRHDESGEIPPPRVPFFLPPADGPDR